MTPLHTLPTERLMRDVECGLAANKKPGVRPLAYRDIWMRLIQACMQVQTKYSAKVCCAEPNSYVLVSSMVLRAPFILRKRSGQRLVYGILLVVFMPELLSSVLRIWRSWRPLMQCMKWTSSTHRTLLLPHWIARVHITSVTRDLAPC